MKILKKIGIVLLGLILLLVVISFFLPRKVHIERSLEMKAKPEAVFTLVNNLKMWEQWSPWHKIDTTAKMTYNEIPEGVGAYYTWNSDNKEVGHGKLAIIESTAPDHIKTQLDFEGMSSSFADFNFVPTADGVKVTWTMDADMGMNPMHKFFGLMMEKFIGPSYEQGLAGIKEIAEKTPEKVTIAGFDFEERQIGKMNVLGIREKMNVADINSAKFGEWFGAISRSVNKHKLQFAGAPMAIYYSYDNNMSDLEAAIPVAGEAKDDGKVKYHEVPACKALVVKYFGNYNKVEPVYNAAFEYIGKQGMKSAGPPMEIYVTDPATEKDTTKWLTEIAFPIQ